jgi:DNA-binding MarR family transcriptional regulator
MDDEEDLRDALSYAPLMRLVGLAGHVTGQRFNRVMSRQHGLTYSGVAVLSALGLGPGGRTTEGAPGRMTHAELARRLWLTRATLTGVVDTLEKAGYVRRERDGSDRRVVWLVLTEAGRERLKALGRDAYEAFPPTPAESDPAKEKVIREFLIDVIVTHYEKE